MCGHLSCYAAHGLAGRSSTFDRQPAHGRGSATAPCASFPDRTDEDSDQRKIQSLHPQTRSNLREVQLNRRSKCMTDMPGREDPCDFHLTARSELGVAKSSRMATINDYRRLSIGAFESILVWPGHMPRGRQSHWQGPTHRRLSPITRLRDQGRGRELQAYQGTFGRIA